MGTKQNPGPFDCYAKAKPDEPMFVLLARDPLAPEIVRRWAELRKKRSGGADSKSIHAFCVASNMENWARAPKPRAPGEHTFEDRADGLQNCLVCGGAEATLPTHCPGVLMSAQYREQIAAGILDYRIGGVWHLGPVARR